MIITYHVLINRMFYISLRTGIESDISPLVFILLELPRFISRSSYLKFKGHIFSEIRLSTSTESNAYVTSTNHPTHSFIELCRFLYNLSYNEDRICSRSILPKSLLFINIPPPAGLGN